MAYKKRFICHKTLQNHNILVNYKDQSILTWKAVSNGVPQGSFTDPVSLNLSSSQTINIKAQREWSSNLDGMK